MRVHNQWGWPEIHLDDGCIPLPQPVKGALHYDVMFNPDEQEALHQSNTHCMRAGWWREVLAILWDEGVQL